MSNKEKAKAKKAPLPDFYLKTSNAGMSREELSAVFSLVEYASDKIVEDGGDPDVDVLISREDALSYWVDDPKVHIAAAFFQHPQYGLMCLGYMILVDARDCDAGAWLLDVIQVDPAYHGRGVGARLWEAGLQEILEPNYQKEYEHINVFYNANEPKVGDFYLLQGFTYVATVPHYGTYATKCNMMRRFIRPQDGVL